MATKDELISGISSGNINPRILPSFFDDVKLKSYNYDYNIQKYLGDYHQTTVDMSEARCTLEKGIFSELTSDFKQFGSKFDNTDLVLKSIDFANLESTAEKQNTSTQTDYSRSERVLVKEGGWSSDDEYKTTYPYTKTVIDHKKKVKDFIIV